ncbi:EthD family reductase [Alicyclobacillaceae bacterium I2511]|nr:EthD family reductase [Alicyclobacillaceae bacterium I2511]
MVKMVALYRRPPDVDAFMAHYEMVHLPLVRNFPGLLKLEVNRMFAWDGTAADPFLQVDMYFDKREQLLAALKSPSGRASGKDAQAFAGEYIQIFFADVEVETFGGGDHGTSSTVRDE